MLTPEAELKFQRAVLRYNRRLDVFLFVCVVALLCFDIAVALALSHGISRQSLLVYWLIGFVLVSALLIGREIARILWTPSCPGCQRRFWEGSTHCPACGNTSWRARRFLRSRCRHCSADVTLKSALYVPFAIRFCSNCGCKLCEQGMRMGLTGKLHRLEQ